MVILRDLSLMWTMLFVLILFAFLYESRYSRKKTALLTVLVMGPVVVLNMVGVLYLGVEAMAQLIGITGTVPSLIFFYSIAKNRDFRFLFTFCLVDTLSYEVLVVTRLLDWALTGNSYVLMFVSRLLIFPIATWVAWRYLRKPYLAMMNQMRKGWGLFTLLSVMYYALLLIMSSYPAMIYERPGEVPAMFVVLLLMPSTYLSVFHMVHAQLGALETQQREAILRVQVGALNNQLEERKLLDEQMRIQRHDTRHHYAIISEMIQRGSREEALAYIRQADTGLCDPETMLYSNDPMLNAALSYYCRKAKEQQIQTDVYVVAPKNTAIPMIDLAVVLSNLMENAINACVKLPADDRVIICKAVDNPQFMLQVKNPFTGKIMFDESGYPTVEAAEHGVGMRSIKAFCEHYGGFAAISVKEDWFIFSLSL